MNQGEKYMKPVEERAQVFATGVGAIEPIDEFALQEVIESSDRDQKEIQAPGVVCIDARPAVEAQPVREKVGGGNLSTFLFAAAAVNWSGFKPEVVAEGPVAMTRSAATFLSGKGEVLGCHQGNCGANNEHAAVDDACGEHSSDEQWTSQAERHLGGLFNPDHWKQAQAGCKKMAADKKWREFNAAQTIEAEVAANGGVVEKLDGTNTRPDLDPENKRHGHFEQGIRVNAEAGKSNDRDHATVQKFQVDVDPLIRMAQNAGKDPEEVSLLLHAEVMRQYGIAYVLTKNQPIF